MALDAHLYTELTCKQCVNAEALGFDFSFAFQPIISVASRSIISYEALARGLNGEPSATVFKHVNADNLYRFDQACRVKAIKLAVELGLGVNLNLNFSPNAVYKPELCIRTTLLAADTYGFPKERIVFEVTEGEKVEDRAHLANIINAYRNLGFGTAIDDFGAGYSGLNLLVEYQPDCIKLDRVLISDIDRTRTKQAIVKGVVAVCSELGIAPLAEGVETMDEFRWLRGAGIDLYQGYLFARPGFQALPVVDEALFDA